MVKKSTTVAPIPEEYQGATPYLCIRDCAAAIEFYKKAFGATEVMRLAQPDGKLGHAEIKIGGAAIMLADEFPEFGVHSPKTIGGSPVTIHLYVENVDAFFAKAVDAGAIVKQTVKDEFYGDRSCRLEDPFGHSWSFATHIEDVSPEEMQRRFDAFFQ
jgi:PhnB protein